MENSDLKKPPRLTNSQLQEWLETKSLTKEQRLLKSVIKEAELSRTISEKTFKNLEDMYRLRRKYKNYSPS